MYTILISVTICENPRINVSDFYLVADSVEELRNLIASFSESDSENNNSNNVSLIINNFIEYFFALIC